MSRALPAPPPFDPLGNPASKAALAFDGAAWDGRRPVSSALKPASSRRIVLIPFLPACVAIGEAAARVRLRMSAAIRYMPRLTA
ncbi:hypothetical protein Bsp3421_002333 [Burkholderia sp. FERM BP-3421]|uniref:hypothetical protein n=1 Tax=Burkholderia sp. FERM BP-3421 TaxID=1494466 RepID=UPI00236048A0|nr:hypothetical protein [Burkholderia sp. FERM BP-3421]WDD92331.1 hypothetical protein Bsp3421_002333 [Burkholderia sp. FERM BP-3421]